MDEPIDDRPSELKEADRRARNALCRVIDTPEDVDAKRELEEAKAEHNRLGEPWSDELRARARGRHDTETPRDAQDRRVLAGGKTPLPVGHRSGVALVMAGEERRAVDSDISVETYMLVEQRISGGEDGGLALLQLVYQHGATYHGLRRELETARIASRRALDALDRVPPCGAEDWTRRSAMRNALDAADTLEAVGNRLGVVRGLALLGAATLEAAECLTTLIPFAAQRSPRDVGELTELELARPRWGRRRAEGVARSSNEATPSADMNALKAYAAWDRAESRLMTPKLVAAKRDVQRQRRLALVGKDLTRQQMALYARPQRRRRELRDVLQATYKPEQWRDRERDRLYAHISDMHSPKAPGAIGIEQLVDPCRYYPPASEAVLFDGAAWLGWRAAGQGINWKIAWDTWALLYRFQLATVGTARGGTADAVKKTRTRNPAI